MRTKVLFLIPTLENGGAEKVLVNLVNNMDLLKYDITVQTLFDCGVHKKRIRKEIRYKSFMRKPFKGYSRIIGVLPSFLLYRVIVKEQYDLVISYLEGSTAKIVSGCKYLFPDSKRIAWIHTVMDTSSRLCIGFPCRQMALETYESFKRVIFVSQSSLNAFRNVSGIELPQGKVIYNTNETDKIRCLACEQVEDNVIDNDTFNICIVGKITSNKGVDRLAHVLKRFVEEKVYLHVYVIGTGEQQSEIEDYLKRNKLENYFSFLGYQENPYKYMASCNLVVCASFKEGLSTVVTEALIIGIPVVSTNCSGAYELLGFNSEYGIVTENSEEGIYEAIKKLVTNPQLLKHYQKQAKVRGNFFSIENTISEVESMIEEVLNE